MKTLGVAILAALFAAGAFGAKAAENIVCPDLARAQKVSDCPTEDSLKYTYLGYCGDDRRMYENDNVTCTSYENFKALKNTALWESEDGAFQGYVSCALDPAKAKSLKAEKITVTKQGALTKLICAYPEDIKLTRRSKSNCKVEGDGACGPDGAACKAVCE